jgi:hypothetical protein
MSSSADDARPVNLRTGKALEPKGQPGYYPGFHTMSQKAFWDEATRSVIVTRVEHSPPIRFFSPEDARLMAAICDRIPTRIRTPGMKSALAARPIQEGICVWRAVNPSLGKWMSVDMNGLRRSIRLPRNLPK